VATRSSNGPTFWLSELVCLITSSLSALVNFIAPLISCAAPGMNWMRLPFSSGPQFVTESVVLAFPPRSRRCMQLMDKVRAYQLHLCHRFGNRQVILPTSAVRKPHVGASLLVSGHPEVYVLISPHMGIVARHRQQYAQGQIWGDQILVYSVETLGFLYFIVWAQKTTCISPAWARGSPPSSDDDHAHLDTSVIIPDLHVLSLWGRLDVASTPDVFSWHFCRCSYRARPEGCHSDLNLQRPQHDTTPTLFIATYTTSLRQGKSARCSRRYLLVPKNEGRMITEIWGTVHFWGSLIS